MKRSALTLHETSKNRIEGEGYAHQVDEDDAILRNAMLHYYLNGLHGRSARSCLSSLSCHLRVAKRGGHTKHGVQKEHVALCNILRELGTRRARLFQYDEKLGRPRHALE